jgi:hypothetical protein
MALSSLRAILWESSLFAGLSCVLRAEVEHRRIKPADDSLSSEMFFSCGSAAVVSEHGTARIV